MLVATLSILFIVLAVIGVLVVACVFAVLTAAVGLALRSSEHKRLSAFLIWFPSIAAGFAVAFTGYSFFAITHSWTFPEDPLDYFLGLFLGEALSIGVGFAIAARTNS